MASVDGALTPEERFQPQTTGGKVQPQADQTAHEVFLNTSPTTPLNDLAAEPLHLTKSPSTSRADDVTAKLAVTIHKEDLERSMTSLKADIAEMRRELASLVEKKAPVKEINLFVSSVYYRIISQTAKYAEMKLAESGKACPTNYVIGGLGSLARGDISPYSDLDFTLIVGENSSGTRAYFDELLGTMRDCIRGIGESTPKGGMQFCADGLTPPFRIHEKKGNVIGGSPQLFGTPQELAESCLNPPRSRDALFAAPQIAIKVGLQQVGFIHGDRNLLQQFVEARAKIYDVQEPGSSDTIRHTTGLQYFTGSFSHFKELDTLEKTLTSNTGYIDIKKYVLRPITATIGGLCIYHGIEETQTLKCIETLVEKKLLNEHLASKIIDVFSVGTRLRYKAQLTAEKEEDTIALQGGGKKVYELTSDEVAELKECQRILFALRAAQDSFAKGNLAAFT